MTDASFLELYERHRRRSQLDWYRNRYREYERANRQAVDISSVLLLLTTIVALLAGADFAKDRGFEKVWGVLAVVLPAISTAFAAYRGLYAFQEQAKLYRDASLTLQITRAQAPDFAPDGSRAEGTLEPEAYVLRVEEVFRLEQGQWGQIAAEIRPAPGHVREGEEEAGGTGEGTGGGDGGRTIPITTTGDGTLVTGTGAGGSTGAGTGFGEGGATVITATTGSADGSLSAPEEGGVAVAEEEEPAPPPAHDPLVDPEEAPREGGEVTPDGPAPEERG